MMKIPVVCLLIALAGSNPAVRAADDCDRACLEGIMDRYLAAMVAHDPAAAPLAGDLVFTENTVRLPPTEGLWFTASERTGYGFHLSDVQTGQTAWTGILREHDQPVLMSVRLKVVDGRITEAEQIVSRNLTERNLANLGTLPPGLGAILDPPARTTRDEMLRIPDLYFAALDKLDDREVPFDESCYRLENGMLTAGTFAGAAPRGAGMPGSARCANGDIPPALKTIHSIHPRRTPLVDVEKGMTWGVYCFNHRGLDVITTADGITVPSYFKTPNSMPAVEMFKTRHGRITDIFAVGVFVPYGSGDGWAGLMFE